MPPATPNTATRASSRLLAVLAGGLVGSALRTIIAGYLPSNNVDWPEMTLLVNTIGAALLGFYLARRSSAITRPWSVDFWAIGLLGALTTFSALSLEVVLLLDAGRTAAALAYAAAAPMLGLGAARLGDALGRSQW